MFLSLVALSFAGELVLELSPTARLTRLQPVAAGRVDFLVRDNSSDLRPQVAGGGAGLRSARALDLGGDWVVTAWLEDPADTLEVVRAPRGWALRAVPLDAPPAELAPPPSMEEVRSGGLVGASCPVVNLPLVPLPGDEAGWGLAPGDAGLHLARWTEAEPTRVDWKAVAGERARLPLLTNNPERAFAFYRLGALHRDLSHDREAAYYFGRAASLLAVEGGTADLQRAGAFLRVRAWEQAEASAWTALERGAAPEEVLEVLATTTLAGHGELSPLVVGRALVGTSPHPEARLIGATLLARAGCGGEAVTRLREALPHLRGEPLQVARLLIADALLVAALPLDSDTELAAVDVRALRPEWRGLIRARTRLVPMLLQSPNEWLHAIPGLRQSAESRTPEGEESLWLLGQVYEALGEERAAMEAWGALVDRRRALGRGSPGRRLTQVWRERTEALLKAERLPEALDLHAAAWRSAMADALDDRGPLPVLARGYAESGLYDRAMGVLLTITEIEGRLGLPGAETALTVADLYLRTGQPLPALETIAWLRRQELEPAMEAEVAFTAGRAQLLAGQRDEARRTWGRLTTDAGLGGRASAALVHLDAEDGDCEAAARGLARLGAGLPEEERALAQGAVGRCRAVSGLGGEVADPLLDLVVREHRMHAEFRERLTTRNPPSQD